MVLVVAGVPEKENVPHKNKLRILCIGEVLERTRQNHFIVLGLNFNFLIWRLAPPTRNFGGGGVRATSQLWSSLKHEKAENIV